MSRCTWSTDSDSSNAVKHVSVASLKFMIMMQICKDNEGKNPEGEWVYEGIAKHQDAMNDVLLGSLSRAA